MTDRYGHRPWSHAEIRISAEEIEARFATAKAFIETIIAYAEPEFLSGNHIAVTAALIEAHCWLDALTTMAEHDPSDDCDQERRPLQQANERFSNAITRYEPSIAAHQRSQNNQLMPVWREIAAGHAFSAILNEHILNLQAEDTNERQATGHNLAAMGINSTAVQIIQQLQIMPKTSAAIRRATSKHVDNSMKALTEALEAYNNAPRNRERTTAIRVHQDINVTDPLYEKAQQLGEELRSTAAPYMITINPAEPQNTLVAYRKLEIINVKRAVDHYDEYDDSELAEVHAIAILESAERAGQHDESYYGPMQKLAEMVSSNATAKLHTVDRVEFSMFVEALREANDDPNAVRAAALEAAVHDYSGTDILFFCSTPPPRSTNEQAKAITDAARQAGATAGVMRAICAALRVEHTEMGIADPEPTAEQIVNALHMCTFPLHMHQALAIARILGMKENLPEVMNWLHTNCTDANEDDDDYYEDDEA